MFDFTSSQFRFCPYALICHVLVSIGLKAMSCHVEMNGWFQFRPNCYFLASVPGITLGSAFLASPSKWPLIHPHAHLFPAINSFDESGLLIHVAQRNNTSVVSLVFTFKILPLFPLVQPGHSYLLADASKLISSSSLIRRRWHLGLRCALFRSSSPLIGPL